MGVCVTNSLSQVGRIGRRGQGVLQNEAVWKVVRDDSSRNPLSQICRMRPTELQWCLSLSPEDKDFLTEFYDVRA